MKKIMISLVSMTALMTACSPQADDTAALMTEEADAPRNLDWSLNVEMVQGQLYDPWQGEWDDVELRAYQGEGMIEGNFTPPTLRAAPGETLNLNVSNNLPECTETERETFQCWNNTNIHTHGLWISPSGNSDNVLIDIAPGQSFQFAFDIPDDHPAGTFWYHPHIHGATSASIGSGMAGAFIIEGDRLPTMDTPGDIDVLLKNADGSDFHERIWVMQQFQYACRDEADQVRGLIDLAPTDPPWFCEDGDVGRVDGWDMFGPPAEYFSRRQASINGEMMPLFDDAEAGRFERWRMVHAGLRAPVIMSVHPVAENAPDHREVLAGDQDEWIEQYCSGDALDMFQFADDGLTRDQVRVGQNVRIYPGDRIDVATVFPEAGRYCVVNRSIFFGQPFEPVLLSVFDVSDGDALEGDAVSAFTDRLAVAAEDQLDGDVESRVLADLANELTISSFAWHTPVEDDEIAGEQVATMSIIEHEEGGATLSIDGVPFDHNRLDRILPLGGAEEWVVDSNLGDHPFHIHVNPFELLAVYNRDGDDVTIPGTEAYNAYYADLIGTWQDTLLIDHLHTIRFRTRYKRFDGDFLMHCHFASHGDSGMMQMVRIASEADYDAPIGSLGNIESSTFEYNHE